MPTYGYRCTACGHTFERIQKMTDAPLTECEKCGQPVKKMLYPVGISFKGSGFYVNDYAPSAGKAAKPGEEGAAAAGGGETPAVTPETKMDKADKTDAAPAAPASPAPPAAAAKVEKAEKAEKAG